MKLQRAFYSFLNEYHHRKKRFGSLSTLRSIFSIEEVCEVTDFSSFHQTFQNSRCERCPFSQLVSANLCSSPSVYNFASKAT